MVQKLPQMIHHGTFYHFKDCSPLLLCVFALAPLSKQRHALNADVSVHGEEVFSVSTMIIIISVGGRTLPGHSARACDFLNSSNRNFAAANAVYSRMLNFAGGSGAFSLSIQFVPL